MSYGGLFTEVGQEFIDVAQRYDKNRGSTDDINALTECNKYGVRILYGLELILSAAVIDPAEMAEVRSYTPLRLLTHLRLGGSMRIQDDGPIPLTITFTTRTSGTCISLADIMSNASSSSAQYIRLHRAA